MSREARRQLARDNAKRTDAFVEVPREEWGVEMKTVLRIWRSRGFLVQEHRPTHPGVVCRLTINRTDLDPRTGRWRDGITWDELQAIKDALGFEHNEAVELYPRAADVVNDANMRHLWVLHQRTPFGWEAQGYNRRA